MKARSSGKNQSPAFLFYDTDHVEKDTPHNSCVCIRCRGNVFFTELSPRNTYRHTDWWEGCVKHAVEMGDSALIYIPSFIEIGSDIQKPIEGGWGFTDTQLGDLTRKLGSKLINLIGSQLLREYFTQSFNF
jgi:hypothetical protein